MVRIIPVPKQEVNKYEIRYGGNPEGGFTKDSLQCTRIIYAVSKEKVLEYCERMWPNIVIHDVELIEEDIDITKHTTRRIV